MRLRWRHWPPHASSQQLLVQRHQKCPPASSPISALIKAMASFSGEDRQPLRPWFHEFQNTVDIAGLSEDDAMRELRLKLVGVPSALYLQAFNGDDARPTILEVLACLAKDFGIPYEAYVQCRRAAHSSGRDYLRALTTAQRNMQAAGIPLTLSPAEQRYYV